MDSAKASTSVLPVNGDNVFPGKPITRETIILSITDDARRKSIDGYLRAYENFDPELLMYIHLSKYDLIDELNKILIETEINSLLTELFAFSFRKGIYMLMRFLYEIANVMYDMTLLDGYIKTIDSEEGERASDTVRAQTGESIKTKTTFIAEDKFAKTRWDCFQYLMTMRMQSIYSSKGGKFFYKFNRRKYLGY
ncbi:MAG: hypothetical protein Terrestrivirus10_23 [Terrestrivirus sp.]|uniref:Uncharacterized protein n=1 Tax=Terrestrivirus sp. TaxID=2487775 RepID=A0A3G4ZT68_9VIRU|nr:MAG: hypothetical protein Terrestrivirus10_23 [Terrestrivirus sp.]